MTTDSHWSEKPEEKAELERLEKLINLPDDNRILSSRDKQDRHIALLHFRPMPCWLCGCGVNVYFARQSAFPRNHTYNCIRCGVDMKHAVPFLDVRPWYWARPDTITHSEVIAACSQWQKNIIEDDNDEPTAKAVRSSGRP